jgi:hypothetical protein
LPHDTVGIRLELQVGSHVRQQVNCVIDLVYFAGIDVLLVIKSPEGVLRERGQVVLPDIEDAVVVGPNDCVSVLVSRRPLIIIKSEEEHIAVQKRGQLNALGDDFWQVFAEQEGADVVVLELDDVVDDCRHCSVLVANKSLVNGVSIEEFLLLFCSFVEFVSVEDWVLAAEILFKLLRE